jgi:hypothetical protein
LGWLPEVAVEGALAPETASVHREEVLAVGAVEVDLGFEHPGERRGNGDDAAGVGLAVVGLRALEDPSLVGGAANLERLAPDSLLFAVEDFRDAAVVQAGLGCDVARREPRLSGSLEALAALGAGFVPLLLSALERSLQTPHLGSGFLLVGGVRDCGQPTSCRRYRADEASQAATSRREMRPRCDHDALERPGIDRSAEERVFGPKPTIWLHKRKRPAMAGTPPHAPDENRTRDLRLERPTLFGPREGTVDH